jgi:uncharacterized lipoprotein YmbA
MNIKNTALGITTCLLLVSVTGCITPEPGAEARFYQLQPVPAESPVTRLAGEPVVSVGPIELSPYLSHPQIAGRVSTHEVVYDEMRRWAEPLEKNISWTLCENLAHVLGSARVHPFGSPAAAGSDVTVPVQILRFERQPGGRVLLDASWAVARDGSQEQPRRGSASLEESVSQDDMEHVVAAQSALVAELSRRIAADVAEVLSTDRK